MDAKVIELRKLVRIYRCDIDKKLRTTIKQEAIL